MTDVPLEEQSVGMPVEIATHNRGGEGRGREGRGSIPEHLEEQIGAVVHVPREFWKEIADTPVEKKSGRQVVMVIL